ncbi:MAG: molybdenum cofactor guanylyltransferase [Pedobacter sp.]|nr:MAG: molybdenum cofactor guanylyltransferase [Pedobacter sp.]
MLGVILCGGQSSRMGEDKGLILSNGRTWAQSAFDTLSNSGLRVVVSVNNAQLRAYQDIFSKEELVVDDERIPVYGPLRGLLTVHEKYGDDLLVLATDMPQVNGSIIRELQHAVTSNKQAYVFKHENDIEPLCAIYTSQALTTIRDLVARDQLKKHSLKYVLSLLDVHEIPIGKEQHKYFTNMNTPGDRNSR